jgi:hypothetical protein
MLAYAAQRRRAAVRSADAPYWKAAQGYALGRARELRAGAGFPSLP